MDKYLSRGLQQGEAPRVLVGSPSIQSKIKSVLYRDLDSSIKSLYTGFVNGLQNPDLTLVYPFLKKSGEVSGSLVVQTLDSAGQEVSTTFNFTSPLVSSVLTTINANSNFKADSDSGYLRITSLGNSVVELRVLETASTSTSSSLTKAIGGMFPYTYVVSENSVVDPRSYSVRGDIEEAPARYDASSTSSSSFTFKNEDRTSTGINRGLDALARNLDDTTQRVNGFRVEYKSLQIGQTAAGSVQLPRASADKVVVDWYADNNNSTHYAGVAISGTSSVLLPGPWANVNDIFKLTSIDGVELARSVKAADVANPIGTTTQVFGIEPVFASSSFVRTNYLSGTSNTTTDILNLGTPTSTQVHTSDFVKLDQSTIYLKGSATTDNLGNPLRDVDGTTLVPNTLVQLTDQDNKQHTFVIDYCVGVNKFVVRSANFIMGTDDIQIIPESVVSGSCTLRFGTYSLPDHVVLLTLSQPIRREDVDANTRLSLATVLPDRSNTPSDSATNPMRDVLNPYNISEWLLRGEGPLYVSYSEHLTNRHALYSRGSFGSNLRNYSKMLLTSDVSDLVNSFVETATGAPVSTDSSKVVQATLEDAPVDRSSKVSGNPVSVSKILQPLDIRKGLGLVIDVTNKTASTKTALASITSVPSSIEDSTFYQMVQRSSRNSTFISNSVCSLNTTTNILESTTNSFYGSDQGRCVQVSVYPSNLATDSVITSKLYTIVEFISYKRVKIEPIGLDEPIYNRNPTSLGYSSNQFTVDPLTIPASVLFVHHDVAQRLTVDAPLQLRHSQVSDRSKVSTEFDSVDSSYAEIKGVDGISETLKIAPRNFGDFKLGKQSDPQEKVSLRAVEGTVSIGTLSGIDIVKLTIGPSDLHTFGESWATESMFKNFSTTTLDTQRNASTNSGFAFWFDYIVLRALGVGTFIDSTIPTSSYTPPTSNLFHVSSTATEHTLSLDGDAFGNVDPLIHIEGVQFISNGALQPPHFYESTNMLSHHSLSGLYRAWKVSINADLGIDVYLLPADKDLKPISSSGMLPVKARCTLFNVISDKERDHVSEYRSLRVEGGKVPGVSITSKYSNIATNPGGLQVFHTGPSLSTEFTRTNQTGDNSTELKSRIFQYGGSNVHGASFKDFAPFVAFEDRSGQLDFINSLHPHFSDASVSASMADFLATVYGRELTPNSGNYSDIVPSKASVYIERQASTPDSEISASSDLNYFLDSDGDFIFKEPNLLVHRYTQGNSTSLKVPLFGSVSSSSEVESIQRRSRSDRPGTARTHSAWMSLPPSTVGEQTVSRGYNFWGVGSLAQHLYGDSLIEGIFSIESDVETWTNSGSNKSTGNTTLAGVGSHLAPVVDSGMSTLLLEPYKTCPTYSKTRLYRSGSQADHSDSEDGWQIVDRKDSYYRFGTASNFYTDFESLPTQLTTDPSLVSATSFPLKTVQTTGTAQESIIDFLGYLTNRIKLGEQRVVHNSQNAGSYVELDAGYSLSGSTLSLTYPTGRFSAADVGRQGILVVGLSGILSTTKGSALGRAEFEGLGSRVGGVRCRLQSDVFKFSIPFVVIEVSKGSPSDTIKLSTPNLNKSIFDPFIRDVYLNLHSQNALDGVENTTLDVTLFGRRWDINSSEIYTDVITVNSTGDIDYANPDQITNPVTSEVVGFVPKTDMAVLSSGALGSVFRSLVTVLGPFQAFGEFIVDGSVTLQGLDRTDVAFGFSAFDDSVNSTLSDEIYRVNRPEVTQASLNQLSLLQVKGGLQVSPNVGKSLFRYWNGGVGSPPFLELGISRSINDHFLGLNRRRDFIPNDQSDLAINVTESLYAQELMASSYVKPVSTFIMTDAVEIYQETDYNYQYSSGATWRFPFYSAGIDPDSHKGIHGIFINGTSSDTMSDTIFTVYQNGAPTNPQQDVFPLHTGTSSGVCFIDLSDSNSEVNICAYKLKEKVRSDFRMSDSNGQTTWEYRSSGDIYADCGIRVSADISDGTLYAYEAGSSGNEGPYSTETYSTGSPDQMGLSRHKYEFTFSQVEPDSNPSAPNHFHKAHIAFSPVTQHITKVDVAGHSSYINTFHTDTREAWHEDISNPSIYGLIPPGSGTSVNNIYTLMGETGKQFIGFDPETGTYKDVHMDSASKPPLPRIGLGYVLLIQNKPSDKSSYKIVDMEEPVGDLAGGSWFNTANVGPQYVYTPTFDRLPNGTINYSSTETGSRYYYEDRTSFLGADRFSLFKLGEIGWDDSRIFLRDLAKYMASKYEVMIPTATHKWLGREFTVSLPAYTPSTGYNPFLGAWSLNRLGRSFTDEELYSLYRKVIHDYNGGTDAIYPNLSMSDEAKTIFKNSQTVYDYCFSNAVINRTPDIGRLLKSGNNIPHKTHFGKNLNKAMWGFKHEDLPNYSLLKGGHKYTQADVGQRKGGPTSVTNLAGPGIYGGVGMTEDLTLDPSTTINNYMDPNRNIDSTFLGQKNPSPTDYSDSALGSDDEKLVYSRLDFAADVLIVSKQDLGSGTDSTYVVDRLSFDVSGDAYSVAKNLSKGLSATYTCVIKDDGYDNGSFRTEPEYIWVKVK